MSVNESALKQNGERNSSIDYSIIVKTSSFQKLLHEKRNFIIPWSIFFLVFYFTLPILTAYTSLLSGNAFAGISWAWVFAFAQFIMTWGLCIIYTNRAAKFDQSVEEIKQVAAQLKEEQG